MASTYRHSPVMRFADRVMASLARRGWAPGGITELTIVGRTSGEPRTLPITPIRVDGVEYLVAPYGDVGWVRNLRAAGTATLRRGKRDTKVDAVEVDAATAAPVLKAYVTAIRIVREQVGVDPSAPVAQFEAVASRFPVFALTPVG